MNCLENSIKDYVKELINEREVPNIVKAIIEYKCFLINANIIDINDNITIWLNDIINNIEIIELLKNKNGYVNLDYFLKSIRLISN